MLNETALEKLAERLVSRIEHVNSFTLTTIGKQINRIGGMTPTNAYRLLNTLKYGGDFDLIMWELEKITELNIKDIYEIFEEIAKNDLNFARKFYEYKNVKFVPYEQNIALQNEVRTLARATSETFLNMSNTTAFKAGGNLTDLSTTYQQVIDNAVTTLSLGQGTYQEMMKDTIKELGTSGLRTVNYDTGYSRRLDSSVRMNIMDGMRNTHNRMQEIIGEEVGADGIEISHHKNSAEDHIDTVDGRQFSVVGDKTINGVLYKDFDTLNNSLDRQVSTLNCRHYMYSIVLGISPPRYTEEELQKDKEENEKGAVIDGKHYTNYQITQMQRRIETEVRKQKDIHTMAKASGNNELIAESQTKIRQLSQKYKELSDVSGLPTKMQRLQVADFKRVNLKELGE